MDWREIGPARVICADCRDVLGELEPVERIVTDPVWPEANPRLAGSDRPFELFAEAAAHFPRLARTVVVHLGCVSDPLLLAPLSRAMRFQRVCWLPYLIPGYRGSLLRDAEIAYAFGELPRRQRHRLIPGTPRWPQPPGDACKEHPCTRPLGMVRWLIGHFSNPGDVILDPFMGSGTTGVAAVLEGRRFVGVEIDRGHFELACRQLADAQRQGVLFAGENDGRAA